MHLSFAKILENLFGWFFILGYPILTGISVAIAMLIGSVTESWAILGRIVLIGPSLSLMMTGFLHLIDQIKR